jgi:hypothetical protein
MILPERTLRHRDQTLSPQTIAVTLAPCIATENGRFLTSRNEHLRSLEHSYHWWYALFGPRPIVPHHISNELRELLYEVCLLLGSAWPEPW